MYLDPYSFDFHLSASLYKHFVRYLSTALSTRHFQTKIQVQLRTLGNSQQLIVYSKYFSARSHSSFILYFQSLNSQVDLLNGLGLFVRSLEHSRLQLQNKVHLSKLVPTHLATFQRR